VLVENTGYQSAFQSNSILHKVVGWTSEYSLGTRYFLFRASRKPKTLPGAIIYSLQCESR